MPLSCFPLCVWLALLLSCVFWRSIWPLDLLSDGNAAARANSAESAAAFNRQHDLISASYVTKWGLEMFYVRLWVLLDICIYSKCFFLFFEVKSSATWQLGTVWKSKPQDLRSFLARTWAITKSYMHLPCCANAPVCTSHSSAMRKYPGNERRTEPYAQQSIAAAPGWSDATGSPQSSGPI